MAGKNSMIKSMTTYIGKAFKAAVIFTGAVALVSGSLMFCCMTKTAQAAAPKVVDHCHPAKSGQHKADHSKTCDCCKIKPGDSDTLVKQLNIAPAFAKSFQVFLADALVYHPQARLAHLAYTGPPRANTSLPIYLQHSCLRL
jgi:hypothetical protein